ncbi:MAG TPA: mannose-1-phosphate guanylyltransferase/mannose-6-phosphate isomerase [Gammaproteobacteria bacterium]
MRIQPVVLAGGGGTRLWPLSREHHPKQFLDLGGGDTLLQETLMRLNPADRSFDARPPLVICNHEHRFSVLHQAQEAGITPGRIILEPVGRNTAPALTVAALLQEDPGVVMVMMPADHRVRDTQEFRKAVAAAADIAAGGAVVTLGIAPDRPETGYGYIRTGKQFPGRTAACVLERFEEKPDAATAARFLEEGGYLWNSGIFVVRPDVWLRAMHLCAPDVVAACVTAVSGLQKDGLFERLDGEAFAKCPSVSVDYAVMERLHELPNIPGAVIPFVGGWSDVGSWSSLWEFVEPDAAGNRVQGDVYALDSRNSAVRSEHRLVAALGVEDLIIIETADAVLVTTRDRAQDVREIVARLGEEGREERLHQRRVYRPWGSFDTVDRGERFQVKRITVMPGQSLSLQLHHRRAEHWVVVRGTATVVRGEETFTVRENESTFIPTGVKHRLSNAGQEPLEIIEVQSGDYLGEDDIVRFEDAYDRK